MKKILFSLLAASMIGSAFGQDSSNDKVRFGLRVTPQPMWLVGDKNNLPSGAKFGVGFGLNLEFRISGVASFLTGIGGDFEGGKYQFKNAPNYEVKYWLDENNEFVAPGPPENRHSKSNTAYILKERSVRTTYVSIPLLLKLSTKEFSGLKYFGMFGGELGFRVKALANDTYLEARKYSNDSTYTVYDGETSMEDMDIMKETNLFRLGLNAGIGAEYRLAGSTSAFVTINFFNSFTNLTKKESEVLTYKTDKTSGKPTYVDQSIKQRGIRITLGIMF